MVREPIAPDVPGQIFVNGEIWRAVSDQPIAAGTRARIIAMRGLEVTVRSVAAENPGEAPNSVASNIR
jgi:membrane-bound ClpP family serine protease